jgi:hypothetical protein
VLLNLKTGGARRENKTPHAAIGHGQKRRARAVAIKWRASQRKRLECKGRALQ